MKKNILITICLLFSVSFSMNAVNRYWVGGTGSWNDINHWSSISGGSGGSSVPASSDDVFFDENAVDNTLFSVTISGIAQCHNLVFSENLGSSILAGNSSAKLNIYGSLEFSDYIQNAFRGEIAFKGTGTNVVDFRHTMPKGDVRFNGNATSIWDLNSELLLSFDSKIIMEAGQLNTSGRNVQAFGIQWVGTASKSLDITNSKLVLAQMLDESGVNNSSVIKSNTNIYPRTPGGSRAVDSVHFVVTAPLCNNSSDGSITVTVFSSSGGGPYTYQWDGGACSPAPCFGNPLNGISNGSYLLTIQDNSDFSTFQQFVTVIAPNPIGSNFVRRKPKCFGQCNGSIAATVVVGSGTAPYTYSWNTTPVQTTPTAINLCVGTYILTVKDAHNCTQTFTQTLTQPAAVTANPTSTNLTCNGVCNGTATSAGAGGNVPTPYTYSWTGPPGFSSNISNPTGLCAGVYNVTVKDDSLCSGNGSVTITEPPALVITPSSTNVSCNGVCDGTATVSPVSGGVPPYSYAWTNGGSGPSQNSLCAGNISVVVSDANGCSRPAAFTITQPAAFSVSVTGVNVSCFGGNNGSVTATVAGGTGPFTYNWNPGPINGPTGFTTNTLSSQIAGTYVVNVTDAHGCTATASFTITQPTVLAANPVPTNILCFGQCNGSVTSTPTGGTPPYSYLWASSLFPPAPTGQNTATISNLCAGTYSVTVTDSKGCTSMQSVNVTVPPQLVLTIAKTNVQCKGFCNGTATVTAVGGTGPYSYSWSGTGATTIPYTGQGTPTITGLCPGVFTVTVTDANGCVKTISATITEPNVLNVTLTATTLLCNAACNATITSTVSGGTPGYTYAWTAPGSPTTPSITNQCAGVYSLTVTDSKGCTKTVSITVTQPTPLVIVTSSTNVSCFGSCNGTASAIAGGGTPGYSYSWSNGANTANISGLCAGSYTVTVTDANGCSTTSTVVITSPPQLFGNPAIGHNVLCSGACDGTAYSAPSGGMPPYTYNWSGPGNPNPTGDGTDSISNLCANNYSLIVTDANGCISNQSVTISQPSPLGAPITGSTSSCNICNGTATVTPTGGTPPYTFLWNDGAAQTTATATGLCPNNSYTVIVKDANNCTASSIVFISQTIVIQITTSNTTLSCNGTCDGIATANPSGGQNPYSFQWVGPSGTVPAPPPGNTVTGLCVGSYTVTVVDANGCLNKDSVTFTNPPAINLITSSTNATCGGVCNGTATGTASGGTGAFTYSWNSSPSQPTATATNLCAGSYTLTVKDGNNCPDSAVVAITEPTAIVDNPTVTNAACLVANGSITVAPTGGTAPYTYNWAPGAITGQGTPTVTNLLPGAYTLAITGAAGCTYNFNYLISNVNGPNLVMSHTNASCNSVCDGTASVVASAGTSPYTYNWNGTPAGDLTPTITGLCGTATAYTVTVTDAAGCISIDTATIINPSKISPNPVIVNESCGGSGNGSITLNPSGGTPPYSYAWSGGLPNNSSQSGLSAGPYTVTVTDANMCDSTLTINITSPPVLNVTLSSTNVLCNGACNGTATATITGGTGADSISWSNLPASIILPNIVNLCPNQYIVTVTDANNCVAKDTVDITEPSPLIASTSQTNATCNAVCNGMSWVTASGGTPGYSYSWSPGVIPANDTASSLCAGSYTVVVTDANGCTTTPGPVNITEPPPIVPNVTFTNPTCNGSCNGTAISAVSGGTAPYGYNWSGTPAGDGTSSVTGLCAGNSSLTITDGSGCSSTQNFTLIDPSVLMANLTSTSPSCQNSCNGSVTAVPSGGTPGAGYTYSWSPGGATTSTVLNLCPNVYQLIVTDANNCKDTQTVAVINPSAINIAVSSAPASCGACDGTISINPITGTGPYTYLWSPAPTAGQSTPNASSVCAGLYDVTVTDSLGCDSTFTIPMNNSGGPTGETVGTISASCNGMCNGSGWVIPIGGVSPYTYLWNDSVPTMNDTAINLCAGNYFVQVTDSNVCIRFSPVTITQPAPILSNGTVTNAICSNVCNGVISLTPGGGTPGATGYTYVWSPPPPAGQGTSTVTGLCPGTYSVTIGDSMGCTKLDSFVVNQSTPLTVTAGSTNISCSNLCNGMAYLTISSGTPPFTIQWDDPSGQTNDTAIALCAGVYTASITDANGCTTTVSVTITSTPAVVLNATVTNATCGVCDGSAVAAPSGGTAPYTLLWSNGQSGLNVNNLCSGLYTVNVTDNAGCSSSFGVPVSNTGGPTSLAITLTNVTCNGANNGAVTAVTPSGGTAPYSYLWIQGGQTTPTLAGLSAGVYFVEVTDASGCSILDSVTITEPAPIMANQVVTAATCGVNDGSIAIIPSGGSGSYIYLWNTSSTNDTLTGLAAGVYSVQITDGAGCSVNAVIPVNNQNGPSLVMSSTNVTCNAACNGTATVIPSGIAPFSYLWNDVSLQTTPTAGSLCPGNYDVQVTGANGCISIGMVNITEPDPIAFSIANTIDPLCNGDTTGSITVIPSGGTLSYTYSWAATGGNAATASNLAANTYTVTVTDANGCTATQSTTLIQTAVLTISSAVVNPSCSSLSDGSIDVTVTGGTSTYTYLWSGSSSAVTEDLTNIAAGTYMINVTDGNGCTIADTSVLIPSQSVAVSAGNDTTFCENGAITLNATGTPGVTYQWFQIPGNTNQGSTPSVTITPPAGTTSYYVVADNGTGCIASDTITLTSNTLPVANAGSDVTIVIGESTTIGGNPTGSTGTTIVWSPVPGLDNATVANPTATPTATTTYSVAVTTPQGCSASDSMIVTVLPTIMIPDGISPNADGDNDEWIIDGIELFPDCVVEVYNRWGELLFQSVGYKEHWKGTYKGKDLPVGSYYYVIDLKDPKFPDVYTGPITILR